MKLIIKKSDKPKEIFTYLIKLLKRNQREEIFL